jgi:transposase
LGALEAARIGCILAAPGKIERPAQDRIKTDQRDAERVLRLLMIGGLHAVRVPNTRRKRCATWSGRARTCVAI